MKSPILNSKFCILVIFFLAVSNLIDASNYYFSTSLGNDSRTGLQAQNPNTPWRTIDKLNSVIIDLKPGDSVLFKKNDSFYGSIVITRSGSSGAPIYFSSYGIGSNPILTAFTAIQTFTNAGNGIWETTISNAQLDIRSVLVNNAFKRIGRYPNEDAINKGYLGIDAAIGTSSITDFQLSAIPNWTGGETVIRKARWVLDKNPITLHLLNTINYTSQSGYGASAGYGYFIQNHPKTLDQNGEWYYQSSNKKFGIYFNTGTPAAGSVQVSTIQSLVNINNQSNISFSNLNFIGANKNAIEINSSANIKLSDCQINYTGFNAINALNSNYLSIENCTIYNTNNIACNIQNCNNTIIKNNVIRKTGTYAGMGDGDSGSYEGLLLSGNNQTIQENTIDSTGYIPLTFSGNNITILNNVITNFAFVKDDGGGIYTWNNGSNPPINNGRKIIGNIVMDGKGAGEGTPEPEKLYAHGIYMDDNAGGVEITNNTVASCSSYGLYIHNAHDLIIKNNTVYNNAVQLEMTHDDIANYPITNVTMNGNTFLSKEVSQSVAEFKTNVDDIANFGTFDNNYYSRPLFDKLQIGVLRKVSGNYIWNSYDLAGWQAIYQKDLHSNGSPFSIAPYKTNSIVGSNLFSNGNFDNNTNGLYVYSSANNASAAWKNGILDGGALQVSFAGLAGNSNKATVIVNVGTISANKKYILKFSLKGQEEQKLLEAYLRYSNSPYSDIAARNYLTIHSNRSEQEILFTPTTTTSSASIGFDIPESTGNIYIDNIQLLEANVTITDADDSIRFIYNTEKVTKSFPLDNTYKDIANNTYSNSIALQPYTSLVLLKKNGAQPNVDTSSCSATGSILREQWNNIVGSNISNIPLQTSPTSSGQINSFESVTNVADNYGARIRGYICPPQTGNYIFWIASDDGSELWLSTDENPANKSKIAYTTNWTNAREWNKYPSQKSISIRLLAGRKYYIEAVQQDSGGDDNLAVAWQLPNGSMEGPIPGNRLSPFVVVPINQTISFSAIPSKILGDQPFLLTASASSGLPVSFNVASGPATINGNIVTLTGPGTVTINASQLGNAYYNAAAPVLQSFVVSAANLITCAATGTILRQQWNNIPGNNINSIPVQSLPNSSSQLSSFESPTNIADNYGARIRGYICPPQAGNYTFWIASDDAAELWLSMDDNPNNKIKIAYTLSYTASREWNKFASQKSVTIPLQAGKRYYIEALHKEGDGGDNLAVAWLLPSGTFEGPIPGTRLSPFVETIITACVGTGSILREQWNNIAGHNINSIPLQTAPALISQLNLFESPMDVAESYGARIHGYICAPQTGDYIFWIAGDDEAELWLGAGENDSVKTKIAYVPAYTGVREWGKYASQKSVAIRLQAGYKYYIEALQKEGDGQDHLSVAWQLPSGNIEAPIPGSRLMPYFFISNYSISKGIVY